VYVTARQAAELLGHAGLSRSAARRLLATGVAGEPVPIAGARLYERAVIEALVRRRRIAPEPEELPELCRQGVMVARTAARPDPLEAARGPLRMSLSTRFVLAHLIDAQGALPLVVTVSSFVLAGAEVVGGQSAPGGMNRMVLDLQPAGEWFDTFRDRVFRTPPGNPWLMWGCRLLTPAHRR